MSQPKYPATSSPMMNRPSSGQGYNQNQVQNWFLKTTGYLNSIQQLRPSIMYAILGQRKMLQIWFHWRACVHVVWVRSGCGCVPRNGYGSDICPGECVTIQINCLGARFSEGGWVSACVSRQGSKHQWFEIWKVLPTENLAPRQLIWIKVYVAFGAMLCY